MVGGSMNKEELQKLTNEELYKKLAEVDYLDRDLLREHDERTHDGRIKLKIIYDLEEHFRKRRERKKAS